MTVTTDLPTPERALAIAAHPDDIEFGAGATLAKWADDGCEVSLLICTDGSKGTWDAHADTDKLVVTRQAEMRRAAEILGATGEVVFLGWTDGLRSPRGSVGCVPTSCSATIRGSATGCIPIIAMPAC